MKHFFNFFYMFGISLGLSACGGFLTADITDLNPTLDKNRIVLKNEELVEIRSYGSSSLFSSSKPTYINIASVIPPSVPTSFGSAQATSLAIKNSHVFVAYNTAGDEIYGALDVIDVSNPYLPKIIYTFTSENSEFSDIKIKNDILYLVGTKKDKGATLLIFDISTVSNPLLIKSNFMNGEYATSLDINKDTLMISTGTSGGVYKFNISNPRFPIFEKSYAQENALFVKNTLMYDLLLGGKDSTSLSFMSNDSLVSKFALAGSSNAPARFTKKNSLIYINDSETKNLYVFDYSPLLNNKPLNELSKISIPGDANGITQEEQTLFLAQGDKGFYIVDIENPKNPIIAGDLYFNDSGSANNIWAQTINNQKYLFLADGLAGLRIIHNQDEKALLPSPEISFYAKGSSYLENAKVLIRVNNENFKEIELDDSEFKLYTEYFNRAISASDKVEIIFLNALDNGINQKRNAFVSFLKVNGKFCYQQETNSDDDIGLLKSLQTISIKGDSCLSEISNPICSPNSFKNPSEQCELSDNRKGVLMCDNSGTQYFCQDSGDCQSGFSKVGGECKPAICSPNTDKIDCSDTSSIKEKTCNNYGTEYGQCEFVSCQSNFYFKNGECSLKICSPNSNTSCSVNNGSGSKTCSGDGTEYGSCSANACNSGYYLSGGDCVPQICSPNSAQECSVLNLKGTRTCNSDGSSLGSCDTSSSTTCNSGFYYFAGTCMAQTCSPGELYSCSTGSGTGEQLCNSQGSALGSCIENSCSSGYYFDGSTCQPQNCTPSQSRACSSNHLIGTETCNSQGSSYSSCNTSSSSTCESGYYYDSGVCKS